jgi:hypothetical protein
MIEDVETRALERIMIRRGELPPPAVTIEPRSPTLDELRNIPRGHVMTAIGELGRWLQAAAEHLDRAGVEVPGVGRITAKDLTLGDVGAVLENISYGFGPVSASTGGTDPVTGGRNAAHIKLSPQALELLNLTVLPGVAQAARAAPRAAAAAVGAAALAPGEAQGETPRPIPR